MFNYTRKTIIKRFRTYYSPNSIFLLTKIASVTIVATIKITANVIIIISFLNFSGFHNPFYMLSLIFLFCWNLTSLNPFGFRVQR